MISVIYEWAKEFSNDYGDIEDSEYYSTYSELMRINHSMEGLKSAVVLIRLEGNEAEGITHRSYAYLKNGKLPLCFIDICGHEMPNMKVPKKYLKQVK